MFFPKRETTQKTNKNWQERPAIRECHVTCNIKFGFARSTSLLLIFFRDEIHQGYTVFSLSSGHFLPSPDGPFSGLATARKYQYPLCSLDRASLSGVRDWPKFFALPKSVSGLVKLFISFSHPLSRASFEFFISRTSLLWLSVLSFYLLVI